MYKIIKGLYKKGRIIPMEPLKFDQEEIEIFITFLQEEKVEEESLSSADNLLYTMGDRALEGRLSDASVRHDQYLYSQGKRQ